MNKPNASRRYPQLPRPVWSKARASSPPTNVTVPSVRGIYRITCIPLHTVYVGSSHDIALRWLTHQTDLLNGIHGNSRLQRSFNYYGPAAFVLEILEYVHDKDPDILYLAEQRHMDAHPTKFNVRPAGSDEFIARQISRRQHKKQQP